MSDATQAPTDALLWQRAERHLADRNIDGARLDFELLVRRQPGHVLARLRLSTLATTQGRYRDSVSQLLAIAALAPEDPHLVTMLAGMLHRLGESRAALDCLEGSALDHTDDKMLLEESAQLASQLEAVARSHQLLDHADRFGGPSAGSLYTRATLQLFEGSLGPAQETLEQCLRLAPSHPQAHWALSRVRRNSQASNHVAGLRDRFTAARDPASQSFLGFALFKELDDLDRPDEAWDALVSGCHAKRQLLDYRPADEQAAFDVLQGSRTRLSVQTPVVPGEPEPIFIIGMPRTGTTLLERILGRHAEVQHAGELDDFPLQLRWLANRFSRNVFDAGLVNVTLDADRRLLAERYLSHARWRAAGKRRFTDKMPLNFLHVGLIAESMPQARILHMVRNPMDTCFSNLKELFADAYPYSYQLDELAAHYGRYRRLMAHWHERHPGRVLDIAYEDLVSDPAAEGRRAFEFCGLDWDPSVVDIQDSGGTVTTASSVQVREPIHRERIAGWRKYECQLEPLRQRLQADGWLVP